MALSFTRFHLRNPRTLWRGYAVGLLLVVAAFLASHIITLTTLKHSEDNTRAMNVSEQQLVLSQRVSYLAATGLTPNSANQGEWVSELSDVVTRLERAHHALVQGGDLGLTHPLQTELRPYYFHSDHGPSLDQQITTFIDNARLLSHSRNEAHSQEVLTGANALLQSLDRAVSAHEAYALAHIHRAKTLSRLTLGAALLLVLVQVFLIFWPAHRTITHALNAKDTSLCALEADNKNLKHFSHLASHDLKAPLNGMKNLVEWIEEDVEPVITPDIKHNFDLLKSRIYRMNTMMADILYYARIGQNPEPETKVNIQTVVESVSKDIAQPDTFEIITATPLPVIMAPGIHIQKIFNVLISNAVKHQETQTGTLTISHHIDDTWSVFTFSDDGPGIEPKYHDYIFAMFNRLKSRDDVEGSGIGLPIARKTAELLGGALTIASEDGGKGSTFILCLPQN